MNRTLTQTIRQILDAHSDGLTAREIRRAAIEESGLRCTPRQIRDALRRHADLFISIADGVWRSKAAVEGQA